MTNGRRLARSALLFLGIVLLGAVPHPWAAPVLNRVEVALVDGGLSCFEFGKGGRARVAPLAGVSRGPGDNVDADALLLLSVAGFDGDLPFGISLRRDVFLPWLILAAVLAAAPISRIVRLFSPLLAALIVGPASVGAYALLSMWTFTTQVRGVYTASPAALRFTEFAYGALLVPPGNRFIAPLGVGLLIVFLDRRRRSALR